MPFKSLGKPLSNMFRPAPPNIPPPAPDDEKETSLSKLEDGERLRTLAGLRGGASPAVPLNLERSAQERMAQLIDAGRIDFAELCTPSVNIAALLAVASHSGNPDHLQRALG